MSILDVYEGGLIVNIPNLEKTYITNYKTLELIGIMLSNIIRGDMRLSNWIKIPNSNLTVRIAIDKNTIAILFSNGYTHYIHKISFLELFNLIHKVFQSKIMYFDNELVNLYPLEKQVSLPNETGEHFLNKEQIEFLEHMFYAILSSQPEVMVGFRWENNKTKWSLITRPSSVHVFFDNKRLKTHYANVARIWLGILYSIL